MNIKALITTLVLGSSSAAMADSFTVSGSVNVSLGGTTTARPAPAPYHHQPVVVVAADDCNDNAPAPRPVYHPTTPVYRGPFYNPTNTTIGANASIYTGWLATSPVKFRRMGYGKAIVFNKTVAHDWFDLTAATRIDSGREIFKIGADNGVFKALKLQGLGGGRSNIQQVAIEFLDGAGAKKTQKVVLNTWMSAGKPITIDLDGGYRSISRITVYGSTDRGSAYKILAM
jgi:hypothetical protein